VSWPEARPAWQARLEAAPDGGWPPAPDAVPVVVRAWARLATGVARPELPTTGGFGVSVKRDWSRHRAGRFAEAWRGLLRDGASREVVERLHRARLLVPAKDR
jgi:hypothetical protein